jgi:hypothetical protein
MIGGVVFSGVSTGRDVGRLTAPVRRVSLVGSTGAELVGTAVVGIGFCTSSGGRLP